MVLQLLRGLDADSSKSRRAMLLLHIPYPDGATVYGKWRLWKPGIEGNTLNIFLPSEENISNGAALFRSNAGDFIFAYTLPTDTISSLEDLANIIDNIIQRGLALDIEVKNVQCSHFQMMNANRGDPRVIDPAVTNLCHKYRGTTFLRIHTRLNHAAMALAFTANSCRDFYSTSHLPRPAYLSIAQDKGKLHHFCPTLDDSPRAQLHIQIRDDNALEVNHDSRPEFVDDTNI